ncbi:carbohydrate kinase domain-containing protein [Hirsutella rhossiliensis]|uniref:ATP-dependent (S)-NAD(P)H-hydrate dehydratase n=1 Tax=Hirsutella rhossiliensis TaxID=111463 RepID=A0A9P8N5I5_9HYPO|nr:carbohydrate kinase domain-containing protein [Hirsutella rhossiliensis]KAH0967320.1 carbohydrate kinase domain-containing protein [Hirsutella rhossiliensis]
MSARDQAPAPEMSAATRDVLGRVRRMIPPMLDKFHKGQLGRIAVIGGSEDYTGAPYFSAMASARLGCDMSHVICTPQAGAVIKTYSPNLMDPNHDGDAEHDAARIIDMLPRLHVLVVGPGLGRDPRMQATVARVVRAARDRDMAVVLDADALQLVQRDPDLVRGYAGAVLTPNVVEFGRLWDSLKLGQQQQQDGAAGETGKVEAMAKALGGVTIIQKGKADLISNGKSTLTDDLEGGRKRSGGQGDTLTGSVATFLGWRKAYLDGIWDTGDDRLSADEMMGLAAFGGSAITRESSRLAFLKRGRSLQASDLTDEVHNAFIGLFGEIDGDSGSYKL